MIPIWRSKTDSNKELKAMVNTNEIKTMSDFLFLIPR